MTPDWKVHAILGIMNSGYPNLLSGEGEAYLIEGFLTPAEADLAFEAIHRETRWESREITLFGKKVLQPRLVAWQADPGKTYRYSGSTLEPAPWGRSVAGLRERVSEALNHPFNSVLLNLYRDGKDSMGWHRDNEPELGHHPVIASVSLGVSRRFLFRRYLNPTDKTEVLLTHGSLLVMRGECQDRWEHSLPKALRATQPRINLTFRSVA